MAVKCGRISQSRAPAPPSPEDRTASISPDFSLGSASAKEICDGSAPAARITMVPASS